MLCTVFAFDFHKTENLGLGSLLTVYLRRLPIYTLAGRRQLYDFTNRYK